MDATIRKQRGIHYTPPRLARFLSEGIVENIDEDCFQNQSQFSILDPACGDGMLLSSLLTALPCSPDDVSVFGFDTSETAIENAQLRMQSFNADSISLQNLDFLDLVLEHKIEQTFDCVIANPPYVRTQVLGSKETQRLAAQFGLTGRVDLYQAFTAGISQVLKPGGTMGLLASNRFMTVKAGRAMRRLLGDQFELKAIFDLGDTKVFDAAVLPVILIAVKKPCQPTTRCDFTRVYSADGDAEGPGRELLDELGSGNKGLVATTEGTFEIERGWLENSSEGVWKLTNRSIAQWLKSVEANQVHSFDDLAEIKVGIKTTSDKVFIRDEWCEVEPNQRPESKLLRSLLTHHDSQRWQAKSPTLKKVLYPYDMKKSKRTVVTKARFPKAFAYLGSYRERLESRKYVIESGRNWFEIWVPHQPRDWAKPKVVWPDISERPRFFFDDSGAIVNGDCYWIKLRQGVDPDWLYLMLAVANSNLATEFYDTVFHNKLYAGRRRFMTQYVKQFPLPALESVVGGKIVRTVKKLITKPSQALDAKCETLVQNAFGF